MSDFSFLTTVELDIQFYDTDAMQVVWHGNYAKYLERARCALLDRIDYNYEQMLESGFAWPIIDMHLRYAKPLRFGQQIKISARIVEYELCLKMAYTISDATSGVRLSRATTTQVAVDVEGGEMCFSSPRVLLDKLKMAARR